MKEVRVRERIEKGIHSYTNGLFNILVKLSNRSNNVYAGQLNKDLHVGTNNATSPESTIT